MARKLASRTQLIRSYLINCIRNGHRQDLVLVASTAFNISRQSIHKHLSALVKEKRLIATGKTRSRVYALGPVRTHFAQYQLVGLDEHVVYRNEFSFVFEGLPESVTEIIHYGFTEMVNNAIDHSDGESVIINAERDENKVLIQIIDDGEGIFKRIARIFQLSDPRESILELSKGKLTTDPENHTGEGIFFSSRSFDYYHIRSGDLCFTHDINYKHDYLLHNDEDIKGTGVLMELAINSKKNLGEIFDEYSGGPDEYRFEKTVVPVRLALYEGETLVSRSPAKRILNRVERF